jgi:protease I
VRAFDEAGKPIASLCHGPWVLASAGLLQGRTLTSWPGVRDDLVNAGATWLDQPVVRDGNVATSRGPHDLIPFVQGCLDLFAERAPIPEPYNNLSPARLRRPMSRPTSSSVQ